MFLIIITQNIMYLFKLKEWEENNKGVYITSLSMMGGWKLLNYAPSRPKGSFSFGSSFC